MRFIVRYSYKLIHLKITINKLVIGLTICYKGYKTKKQNKKFQADSNILAFLKAGWCNCLPFVLRLHCFPASQEDKDKMKSNST